MRSKGKAKTSALQLSRQALKPAVGLENNLEKRVVRLVIYDVCVPTSKIKVPKANNKRSVSSISIIDEDDDTPAVKTIRKSKSDTSKIAVVEVHVGNVVARDKTSQIL